MAYQLQPDLARVVEPAVPPNCANDNVITYPQPSSLNYCCRPNTMLYGTAPYMAGKGAPAESVDLADRLRPQSTTQFNKLLVQTYQRNFFPLQDVQCSTPLRVHTNDPASSRADLQNGLYNRRYCN